MRVRGHLWRSTYLRLWSAGPRVDPRCIVVRSRIFKETGSPLWASDKGLLVAETFMAEARKQRKALSWKLESIGRSITLKYYPKCGVFQSDSDTLCL